jgi:hypothetical protein
VNKMFFGFEHGGKSASPADRNRSRNNPRPSAPVSPSSSRPSSPTRLNSSSRRSSLYVDAKVDTTGNRNQRGSMESPNGRHSRRTSVAVLPNGNGNHNTPSPSRRSSMYLDPNAAIRQSKRSNSVSSNSSTSSVSSISTPTSITPDPRSVASALKKAGAENITSKTETYGKTARTSSIPMRSQAPAGKEASKLPQRRQTSNGNLPRPKSMIVSGSGNGLAGKKTINQKRMSVLSESK